MHPIQMLAAVVALATVACGDETSGDEVLAPATGTQLRLPLTATSNGRQYRLRSVSFRIEGGALDGPLVLNGDPLVPFVQADLSPGAYTVALEGEWRLQRQNDGGGFSNVAAVLQSPNPMAVQLNGGSIAEVVFVFGVGDDAIAFGQGKVRVSFDVNDTTCAAGLTHCSGSCVDLATSAGNCGACGSACDASANCEDAACVPGRYVFLSSEVLAADFGGVAGADAECQAMADAAGLPGTYLAWLSSVAQGIGVLDRFTQHGVPYRLVDGTTIANNWADLLDGALSAPIALTELGTPAQTYAGPDPCHGGEACTTVFTGTLADGSTYTGQHADCDGWSTTTFLPAFAGGTSEPVDSPSWWTIRAIGLRCDYRARLYCFQQ